MQKENSFEDKGLHVRNLHREGYDFGVLGEGFPALREHLRLGPHGKETIDYSDPVAVKALNAALLKGCYGIDGWDIPEGFLCPPVPGRVDYIHYVAELLGVKVGSPRGKKGKRGKVSTIKMLDVGTGANGIYALLAASVYGWKCVGCDVDPVALENVAKIAGRNPLVQERLELRLQNDNAHIFGGIIQEGEVFDVCVCNPPFHASLEEAMKVNQRKRDNLARNKKSGETREGEVSSERNFSGQKAELWCKGGEIRFLRKMLKESKLFAGQCRWFTTLVSKSENVKPCEKILRKLEATDVRVIEMKQGKKITRVLAWKFL